MDSLNSIKSAQLNGIMNQYEIPATMRKDGTMRKARKVKPGFVPQEEVPLYQAKGRRMMAQSSPYPPGWHPTPAPAATAPSKKAEKPKVKPETEKPQKPPQPKPAPPSAAEKPRSKEKKEPAKPATTDTVKRIEDKVRDLNIDPTIEVSKRLKRLRRKLREAEILEEKIKSGELDAPERDQLIKLENRRKFEEEIAQLEKERDVLRNLKKSST